MNDQNFNLINDPWIKVIFKDTNEIKEISLKDLFLNTKQIRCLAGDMKAQDLAIMRFLIAIILTVYTRIDHTDNPYMWLDLDKFYKVTDIDESSYQSNDYLETWNYLYKTKKFTNGIINYLNVNIDKFDFFGETPFYQVNKDTYNSLVPEDKKIEKGKGTVAIKQINRLISESGNSISIFSPTCTEYKNKVSLAELVRWIITYQNYAGVTDKTKINSESKFSNSKGWLYQLNSVYVNAENLFDTLILNTILIQNNENEFIDQKPIWEIKSIEKYLSSINEDNAPDNIAETFTNWSRLLYIKWSKEPVEPVIFSAGIPSYSVTNAFVEPMTTWKYKKKENIYRPNLRLEYKPSQSMWRDFGNYVNPVNSNNMHQPGIVFWINYLRQEGLIPKSEMITLSSLSMISDGNATSQSPACQYYEDMTLNIDVLFDNDEIDGWVGRISDIVELTQDVGKRYWKFAQDIDYIRTGNKTNKDFANYQTDIFYEKLNQPFKDWLRSLNYTDEKINQINIWKKQLIDIVINLSEALIKNASIKDFKGKFDEKGNLINVFSSRRYLISSTKKILGVERRKENGKDNSQNK